LMKKKEINNIEKKAIIISPNAEDITVISFVK